MTLRFLRRAAAVLAATASLAVPAAGFDMTDMTETERAALRAEIRDFLLENPEVLAEAYRVLESRQAAQQGEADRAAIAALSDEIFRDGVSWVGGNPDGDVTLVEFLDYRCGFCRQAHPEVAAMVESDGNIRLVIKEFPILGPDSLLASRFAIATRNTLGDAAYAAVHDALITMRGNVSEASLRGLAGRLDLDAATIFAAMEAPEIREELLANRALAQQLNIRGTPTFVLGDVMLRGYVEQSEMERIVAELRAEG